MHWLKRPFLAQTLTIDGWLKSRRLQKLLCYGEAAWRESRRGGLPGGRGRGQGAHELGRAREQGMGAREVIERTQKEKRAGKKKGGWGG
jgi:hypothetical protein